MQMLLGCFAIVTILWQVGSVRVVRLSPGVAENSVLLGCGAGSLGNQILKFPGSAVSSISRETSTPGEKSIMSYRNVGISLPIYVASYPRRHPELFLHRRHLLFGDEGLGSRIWRSLADLHTTVSSLLARNVIDFYADQRFPTPGSDPN